MTPQAQGMFGNKWFLKLFFKIFTLKPNIFTPKHSIIIFIKTRYSISMRNKNQTTFTKQNSQIFLTKHSLNGIPPLFQTPIKNYSQNVLNPNIFLIDPTTFTKPHKNQILKVSSQISDNFMKGLYQNIPTHTRWQTWKN